MALKKPAPKFEDEPQVGAADTAVAEAPEAVQQPAAAAPTQPQAAVAASTAIAKAGASSVATQDAINAVKNFKKEVEAMEDGADFSYGSHRVFKAKDGVLKEMAGDKVVLGKWVKARLLAWGRHFEISPGEDGKSSSDFVGYSKDGVTMDQVIGQELKAWEGRSVADYLAFLRDPKDGEGFEKASKREFIDCEVATITSEEEPAFTEIIQITLSSSSLASFRKYQSDLEGVAKAVAMGLPGFKLPEDPFSFYFIREAAEKGKNSWTKLRISSTLPAKV